MVCKLSSTESNYKQKSKQQLNQLVAVLVFWETLSLPDRSWSWRPKNMAISSAHTHTHTHTHTHIHVCTHARTAAHTQNQSNNSTHYWDINNCYFSTFSTPTEIWQFTIKMVVASKVGLKKHLYKTAHIVQLGLERGFLCNFFAYSKTAGSSKQISEYQIFAVIFIFFWQIIIFANSRL